MNAAGRVTRGAWSPAGLRAALLLAAALAEATGVRGGEVKTAPPLDPAVFASPPPLIEPAAPGESSPSEPGGIGVPPVPIDPWPVGARELSVLTYNVYMRPTALFKNGQMVRAGLLPAHLRGYDVVILNEAFDDDARARLLGALDRDYHQSHPLGSDTLLGEQDGGVVVLSRWPIFDEQQRSFDNLCKGSDCLADKGVLYVRICKEDRPYHVFATHTQANHDFDSTTVRQQQLAFIRRFIDDLAIPAGEPVIIGGDLNVWKLHPELAAEYRGMLETLQASDPAGEGVPRMAPGIGLTTPCTYCYGSNELASDPADGQTILDYLLVSRTHAQPAKAAVEILRPRSEEPWRQYVFEPGYRDLSDHFPLAGRFAFLDGAIGNDCQGTALPPPPPPDFGEFTACEPLVFVTSPDAPPSRLRGPWGDSGRAGEDRIHVLVVEAPPGSRHFDIRVREETGDDAFAVEATGVSISRARTRPYSGPMYAPTRAPAAPPPPPAAALPAADRAGNAGVFGRLGTDGKRATAVPSSKQASWAFEDSLGLSLPQGVRLEVDLQCSEQLAPRIYRLRYLRFGAAGERLVDVMLGFSQPRP